MVVVETATLTFCALFGKVQNPLCPPHKATSERPKVLRNHHCFPLLTSTCALRIFAPQQRALFRHLNFQKWSGWCALYMMTWERASRHNGVRFFDISTSKSGAIPSVLNAFDFDMCFAPQRRALLRHLNFQKWSDVGVFCTRHTGGRATFHLSSDHMAPHPPL